MSNPVWPASLPQQFEAEGYSENFADNQLRTRMDSGPEKVRRKYTAEARQITGQMFMTLAQVATLDTFYTITLVAGTLPFDWVHPRTAAATAFRYVGPPTVNAVGGGEFRIRMTIEILP